MKQKQFDEINNLLDSYKVLKSFLNSPMRTRHFSDKFKNDANVELSKMENTIRNLGLEIEK